MAAELPLNSVATGVLDVREYPVCPTRGSRPREFRFLRTKRADWTINKIEFEMRERNTMKLAFRLSVLMFAVAFAGSAFATTTAAGTLTVTATIATSCTINSPTLAFGTYDPQVTNLTAAKNAQIDLVWTCTNSTAATIWLDEGANAKVASTPAIPQRQMASGALRLAYFLYSDAGMGTVWGNTIATSVPVTGSGVSQNSTVFGAIPGAQNVAPGSFSDSVVVNLKY
jgi:spore coat protein U-like protein